MFGIPFFVYRIRSIVPIEEISHPNRIVKGITLSSKDAFEFGPQSNIDINHMEHAYDTNQSILLYSFSDDFSGNPMKTYYLLLPQFYDDLLPDSPLYCLDGMDQHVTHFDDNIRPCLFDLRHRLNKRVITRIYIRHTIELCRKTYSQRDSNERFDLPEEKMVCLFQSELSKIMNNKYSVYGFEPKLIEEALKKAQQAIEMYYRPDHTRYMKAKTHFHQLL